MNIESDIFAHGRLAATHELYAAGYTRRQLSRAAATGALVRVRQGWYTVPDTDIVAQQGVRVGGRLTCITGARKLGLWVRDSTIVHVAVRPYASRLRSKGDKDVRLAHQHRPGVVVHWTDQAGSGDRFSRSALDCLLDMAMCQSPEVVVAAGDSAVRLGFVSASTWLACTTFLPSRLAILLASIDPRSESITESLTRFRLERLGLAPRVQVRVPGVGRVDFVIGARLVIEVDGWAYHADAERFEADRRRDARLSSRGYRVLRFSYQQVLNNWSEVKAAILAAVARGDHLG